MSTRREAAYASWVFSGQTASLGAVLVQLGRAINAALGPSRTGGGRKLHCSALKVTVKRSYKLLFKKKKVGILPMSFLSALLFDLHP